MNSYCELWGFSQGFSFVSTFLFANTHLNLFIFRLVLQVSNHTTINIPPPPPNTYLGMCIFVLYLTFQEEDCRLCPSMSYPSYVFFQRRKKNCKKQQKAHNHQEQECFICRKKKIHLNSVTSRRPYLT